MAFDDENNEEMNQTVSDNETVDSSDPSDLSDSDGSGEKSSKSDNYDGFNKVFNDYRRRSAGVISEAKRKEAYLKPSVRRKVKSELARRKRNKRNRNSGKFSK